MTTLMHPSVFSWKVLYIPGASRDRHGVGDQVEHAERVRVVLDQRQQHVGPAADVALTHPQLDLLVEHVHHRHRVDRAAVDPDHRDGAAAADGVDRGVQHRQPVDTDLLEHLAGGHIRQQAGQVLRRPGDVRPVRLHPDRVHHGVRAPPAGHIPQRVGDVRAGLQTRSGRCTSTPCRAAISRRSGTTSTPITRRFQCLPMRAANCPTGPSPNTARVPPSGGSA